ncbi:MAG: N-acetylmuramic acid 6-phosphate etherase [Deinococcales bacterium]
MNTEAFDPRYDDLDAWPLGRILDAVIEANRRAADAVGRARDALERAAEGLEGRLGRGGRLVYAGAGTSGRIAVQDAAELPPTFGFERTLVLMAGGGEAGAVARENAEDDTGAAVRDVERAGIDPNDAVVAIAASGRTPYTLAAVRRARELGAFTVGIANNAGAPLLDAADVGVLLDSGPEVLAGSTRLAAGTAQKIALNALSTAVLVRTGGAYRNLMVGMRPINDKLRVRAAEIVRRATGAPSEEAERALRLADGSIREAIVILETGVTPDEARTLLIRHGNRVRDALQAHRGDA